MIVHTLPVLERVAVKHVHCRVCGRVEGKRCVERDGSALDRPHGFRVDDAIIWFRGYDTSAETVKRLEAEVRSLKAEGSRAPEGQQPSPRGDSEWRTADDPPVSGGASGWLKRQMSEEDLAEAGLLWLINTTVFHPMGLALAYQVDPVPEDQETNFVLYATDGTETIVFNPETADTKYLAVQRFMGALSAARDAEIARRAQQ